MRRHILLSLLGLVSVACPQPDIEATDAGTPAPADLAPERDARTLRLLAGGLGGPGNVDGIGADARFLVPRAVAVDGAGNLYVADSGNGTIRKVVLAKGEVTTLVGSPGNTGSGDGTGTAARFNDPTGLALDNAGNLYVADRINDQIRKVVVTTGEVTTFASPIFGGPKVIKADFRRPAGVALDSEGNLYVADTNNNAIRKVVVATGAVTTLAGTPGVKGSSDGTGAAALFNLPSAVVADGAGNLYVADTNNHTIRKVVEATGAVTTLAGTAGVSGSSDGTGAAALFRAPLGMVYDKAGNLYVADPFNHAIRRIEVSTGVVTTLAGTLGVLGSADGTGVAARFNRPAGVALDSAGNLYVAEQSNHTIRKVVIATGEVTTLAGAPPVSPEDASLLGRFSDPAGVAADDAGNLYVADTGHHAIRKVVATTGAVTTVAGRPGMSGSTDDFFNGPAAVAADGLGNLYVADSNNHAIRKVAIATGAITTLAGSPGMSGRADGIGTDARFYFPTGVAADGAGNVYVADTNNCTIRKIVADSHMVTTLASRECTPKDGIGTQAGFIFPGGLALDGAGNLYVADALGDTIRKVVLQGAVTSTLASGLRQYGSAYGRGPATRFNFPTGLALDGRGNLYVTDLHNGTVRKVQLSSGSITTVVGSPGQHGVRLGPLPAGLNMPSVVAVLPRGELIILDESSVLSLR